MCYICTSVGSCTISNINVFSNIFFNPQAPSRTLHSIFISKTYRQVANSAASLNLHFFPFYQYFSFTCQIYLKLTMILL